MLDHQLSKSSGILALLYLLSGCVVSVDAVVSESHATFDPRLLGSWEEPTDSERAVVSRSTGNSYTIEWSDKEKSGRFGARLGRLGDRLVLDIWPTPRENELSGPYADLLIPAHMLVAIDIGAEQISVAGLERDSLLAALRAEKVRMAHRLAGDQLILRGTTEELRAALSTYIARPGALVKPGLWKRAPAGKPGVSPRPAPVAPPRDLLRHGSARPARFTFLSTRAEP